MHCSDFKFYCHAYRSLEHLVSIAYDTPTNGHCHLQRWHINMESFIYCFSGAKKIHSTTSSEKNPRHWNGRIAVLEPKMASIMMHIKVMNNQINSRWNFHVIAINVRHIIAKQVVCYAYKTNDRQQQKTQLILHKIFYACVLCGVCGIRNL